jgi:putative hydrolase of the HAD superfamily
MQWYCVDYWSRELALNIVALKTEIKHLIRIHPTVIEFLHALNSNRKNLILVTNAHQHSLSLKLNETNLGVHFDAIVCAHDFGSPKEDETFWNYLLQQQPFDKEHTLLIDDSLPVLRSAKKFGIKFLLAANKPDSRKPGYQTEEFPTIDRFTGLQPIC